MIHQRRAPRFATGQAVPVTVLGNAEVRTAATVRNVSGRRLGLEAPIPIPAGAAIKVEVEDAIVLAESVFCRKEAGGYFAVIAMDQVLSGLAELGRILEVFQDDCQPREPSPTSVCAARAA